MSGFTGHFPNASSWLMRADPENNRNAAESPATARAGDPDGSAINMVTPSLGADDAALIAASLRPAATGARVAAAAMPDGESLALLLATADGGRFALLCGAYPEASFVCAAPAGRARAPGTAPFAAAVAGRLVGTTVEAVHVPPGERRLRIWFVGDTDVAGILDIEPAGLGANVVLTDAEGRVIATLRPDKQRPPGALPPAAADGHAGVAPRPVRLPDDVRTALARPADTAAALTAAHAPLLGLFERGLRARAFATAKARTLAAYRAELAKAVRRRDTEAAAADSTTAAVLRRRADIAAAAFAGRPRGAAVITGIDFDTGEPVDIAVDPALSTGEALGALYRAAARAERAVVAAAERRPALNARITALEAAASHVEAAQTPAELVAHAAAFPALAPLRPAYDPRALMPVTRLRAGHKAARHAVAEAERALPYRRFTSRDGHEIRVGRSARENDRLTFGCSRGGDRWLHVVGASGSHVVIPLRERGRTEPTPGTLADAALLAVWYSTAPKAAGADAEVQHTEVRNVRRVKGAPPGAVFVSKPRRMRVQVDPDVVQRLTAGGG